MDLQDIDKKMCVHVYGDHILLEALASMKGQTWAAYVSLLSWLLHRIFRCNFGCIHIRTGDYKISGGHACLLSRALPSCV